MAKKVPPFSRTTITVPTELKRRMDKVAEDVNWSALASRAFEQKLAEIAGKKEKKAMSDVVQRLRESKRRAEGEQYQTGLEHGRRWAQNSAEFVELGRINDLREQLQSEPQADWESWFSQEDNQVYGVAENFFFLIKPEIAGERREASDFWDSIVGDENKAGLPGDFVRGFADGALEIWYEVEGEL